jgi:hypothetical protein
MLDKKIFFDVRPPFNFISKYKGLCERVPAVGGASEPQNLSQFSESLIWSQLLNEVRTYFEKELTP